MVGAVISALLYLGGEGDNAGPACIKTWLAPSALISDQRMPEVSGKSGIGACQALLEAAPYVSLHDEARWGFPSGEFLQRSELRRGLH